jgi:hypothetical protein
MFTGLRQRGFRFVTVSELLAPRKASWRISLTHI